MTFKTILEPIKAHPFIVLGGVAAVLLVIQLRGNKSQAQTQSVSLGPDQVTASLQAQRDQLSAQTQQAAIAAATNNNAIIAQRDVALAQIAQQGEAAKLTADTANAQIVSQQQTSSASIAASVFNTAAAAISQNYATQLAANGAFAVSSSGGLSLPAGNISIVPGPNDATGSSTGFFINGQFYGHGATFNTGQSQASNPAGSAVINTANTQIEQIFNNIIRAGQGLGPAETQIVTDGGGSGASKSSGTTLTFDPVFLNLGSDGTVKSITDITAGVNNKYGFSGSYINLDNVTNATFQ